MENENKVQVEKANDNNAEPQEKTNNTQVEEKDQNDDAQVQGKRTAGACKAKASLILSLFAFLFAFIGLFTSIFITVLSIVLAIIGIVQASSAKHLGCDENKGSRTAGLTFSIFSLILCFLRIFKFIVFFGLLGMLI